MSHQKNGHPQASCAVSVTLFGPHHKSLTYHHQCDPSKGQLINSVPVQSGFGFGFAQTLLYTAFIFTLHLLNKSYLSLKFCFTLRQRLCITWHGGVGDKQVVELNSN
jgi:hypothetical protein